MSPGKLVPGAVVAGMVLFVVPSRAQTVGLLREVWEGIDGAAVLDLTQSPDFPDHPTSTNFIEDLFEAPTDVLDNYGQRLRGYIVPPQTGNYTFWVASDDGGDLYLSQDEDPAHAILIARVDSWTSSREWTKESNQESAPVALTAGRAYYVAALMKEAGGGDNLAVRWRMPDGTDQAPIVGTNLLPWGISFEAPAFSAHPTNATAVEGGTARFAVRLSTVGPASYQWQRNGVDLPGAIDVDLVYGPVTLDDQDARFRVVVTNRLGGATSNEARLTVSPDRTPPAIASLLNFGRERLRVIFSEPVSAATATNPSNYSLDPARVVSAARFGPDPETVELTVQPMTYDTKYTLSVHGVQDRARSPNTIATGAQGSFVAEEYAPAVIGTPTVAGAVKAATSGVDITGSGAMGGTADTLEFGYQEVTGDFDRRVRVAAFTPTDPFATAGLMARASLETNGPFAASLSTPGSVGSFFLARGTRGAAADRTGSYPPNFPDTWLRLVRSGDVFRGFASADGTTWFELGQVTASLPATVFLGFSVASADPAAAATAAFRDPGQVVDATVVSVEPTRAETPGPSSRHTPLVISEIMYHPRARADGKDLEFIELYNADLIAQDLTGYRLSGSVAFDFPEGFVLQAGGFAVLAREPADVEAAYGLTGVLGPFAGGNSLPNDGGIVRLRNAVGAILLEVPYGSRRPWPVAADGAGPSLAQTRPSYGEGDPRAWSASGRIGGSPGSFEPLSPASRPPVLINEVLAHTDLPQLDFVELYNHGNDPVDLGGCILTDDPATNRFRVPAGTMLTPRGFIAFDEAQLGFRIRAAGETVVLIDSSLTQVLDAVRVDPQENGVSSGRYPDGTPEWRRLAVVTPGAENTTFRVSEVVLNEIMYAPISGEDDDEFVEVHNRTAEPVDLGGWSFTDGIGYRFPAGTVLGAGGYAVVARDRERLLSGHPGLNGAVVFGNFDGNLSNSGERLALAMPDLVVSTNATGFLVTNRIDIVVDEVTYGTGGRWAPWSDGLGSSLELVDPNSDHLQPSNWADSDESGKAPWTAIEFTGRVDNVAGGVPSDRLHLLAEGPGTYLVDDVEVLDANGASRLVNGDFSDGLTGWTPQGNHRDSALAPGGGVGGGPALRVEATGRGDTAVNRVRAAISPALSANATATLRARVRWLRGWPEFLLRTRGNGLEAYGRLNVPSNLGTPGAPNSRAIANAGPAIFDVHHGPVVPRNRQPVIVTARVTDPDGIDSVTLRYRLDPNTSTSPVTMRDDGTGGDAVGGDGVYSGTLSGRTDGTLLAFVIRATDRSASPALSQFPPEGAGQEALVRWGEDKPFGNLGVYRLWQRKADFDRLRNREPLANDNLDCTFVYGDERVIYNAAMRAKGSPWHGGSVGGDYIFSMPDDDRLLGANDVAVVTIGNLGTDPSAQREQAAFWIGERLGVPTLHRRHVRFFENGSLRGLYEDSEEPNGLYVDDWFPDGPNGELFKIEDWFEFNDAGDTFVAQRDATLEPFTTTGNQLKLARYRWSWRKRAVVQSANDYTNFLALVRTLNAGGGDFVAQVGNVADVDRWMRDFALQHIVGNWDSYGYSRGKNSYLYRPTNGRWAIIPWDIDFVLGSNGDGPSTDVFGSVDPTMNILWDTPAFLRMYWRAFQDAINGPLRDESIGPILDGRYAALTANGFKVENPTATRNYVRQRRAYLTGRLGEVDVADLAITSNNGANFTTDRNDITLTGRAPIRAAELAVNGVAYPLTWSSVSAWSLTVPLAAATNVLQVTALDRSGRPLQDLADSVIVRYTGPLPAPTDLVVISEIQYDPAVAGSAFVEVHNVSTTRAFDLSGWRLDGVDFQFPAGTIARPGGYLVVVADANAFRAAYGSTVIPVGVFNGSLQNNGERLRLVRPGTAPEPDLVVDQVRYGAEAPWPTEPHSHGPSLQLLDPVQDNRRPANWGAAPLDASILATPGSANSLGTTLETFPNLWINEVLPQNTGALTDHAGEADPWIELYNAGDAAIDLSNLHLTATYSNLTQWPFPAGSGIGPRQFLVVWCDGQPGQSTAGELHAGFRLSPTNGSLALVRLQAGAPAALDAVDYRDLPAGKAWGSYPDGDPLERQLIHLATPGSANNPAAPSTLVFVNEWMAANQGAVLDPADQDADDWFELYNGSANATDLSAFTLTDDASDPTRFRIPNGTTIAPGGFLVVWADDESGQNSPGQVHANFRLSASGDGIALFAPDRTLIDAATFVSQSNNVAQGRFPDGAPAPFVFMDFPTPGAVNAYATANQPPVLAALDPIAVDEGALVRFKVAASDPDASQHLRFSLVGAPQAASLDPVDGSFSWSTSEADGPGEYSFSVRVTDDGQPPRTDSRIVTVTVREVNQAPTLLPLENLTVNEGTLATITAFATDPDEPRQHLIFTLEPEAPGGAGVHPETGVFSWAPAESDGPGEYTLAIRVSDDGQPAMSATQSFRVKVNEIDNAPAFDPVSLQTVDETATLTLPLVARDPDTPPKALTYTLESAPSGSTIDAATGVFRWTPPESAGPNSYAVVAHALQAGGGPPGTVTFSIVVNEKNDPPRLASLPNLEVVEGTVVAFIAIGTDTDLPAQKLTYSLDPGAPEGASIDADAGTFRWEIGPDAGAASHSITVRVTDDAIPSASASQTFTVTIRPTVRIVINEIMYAPEIPRTEFVELWNGSQVTPWNLGGWRLTGLDWVFPSGTSLAPAAYLVVARSTNAFRAAYPGTAFPTGDATVAFTATGPQQVRLERPTTGGWETIDAVEFLRAAPWPAAANGGGASLQRIDPEQESSRIDNWAALAGLTTNAPEKVLSFTDVWRYKQDGPAPAGWRDPAFADQTWPSGGGLLYVEDAGLPGPKTTALVRTEGRMTYYFRTKFDLAGNPDGAVLRLQTVVDDAVALFLNGQEIFRLGLDANAVLDDGTAANRTVSDAVLEGPFEIPVGNLVAGGNTLAAEVHQVNATSSDIVWGAEAEIVSVTRDAATPGYVNSVRATLPPLPEVSIMGILLQEGGTVRLTWETVTGHFYQIEETQTIEGGWKPVGSVVQAAAASLTQTVAGGGAPRFFRIARIEE